MNRAERRKLGTSATKTKTYVLTDDQIQKIKDDATMVATRRAFLMFMSIPIMVLHDKFGFGRLRLNRFLEYATLWLESVQNNETKLMEIVKVAEDECGICTITSTGGEK